MTQVDSVDYPNKRIYLHPDTVSSGVDPVAAYTEVRSLRRTTEAHRGFAPIIKAQGNEPKGGGAFTPRRAVLLNGARFVPYDASHTLRILTEVITDDELSGAGAFDRLPLSPGVTVDIDVAYQQVEIIRVTVGEGGGGGATAADIWSYATRSLTTSGNSAIASAVSTALASSFAAITTAISAAVSTITSAIAPKASQTSVDAIATKAGEIHAIHGLDAASPLTVSDSARVAGTITQNISDNGTTTTVQRQ